MINVALPSGSPVSVVAKAKWNGSSVIMDIGHKLDVLYVDSVQNGKTINESVCMVRWTRQPDNRVLYRMCELGELEIIESDLPMDFNFQHVPDNHVVLPIEPTEQMWDGLARQIMVWLKFDGRRTPRRLFAHLTLVGETIPTWLTEELEFKDLDHVPSKGACCAVLYKAMTAHLI